MDEKELKKRIADIRARYKNRLLILAHCYQQDEIVECADFVGDSYALAMQASKNRDAELIVFCGVKFMAEAAAILAGNNRKVFMPDLDAGCPLADCADIDQVEAAWNTLKKLDISKDVVPITYMNSSAELKAFCGKNGGIVCTSSNAKAAMNWSLSQKQKLFFFPDENLGRNTARAGNINVSDIVLWDPLKNHGGCGEKDLANARVILWKGFCHVHTFFTVDHIKSAREKYPECLIAVHPECNEDVVMLSDANGSTSFLKKYVEDAPSGKTIIIGTEINMAHRLGKENPDKNVLPLARSLCPNMFKTSISDLCYVLDNFPVDNEISVPQYIADDARLALERMLNI